MSYLLLNIVFILFALGLLLLLTKNLQWKPALVAMGILFVLTLIFDNIIIALKIVAYDESKLSGFYLGLVPIEDFAYTIVSVLLVCGIWQRFSKEVN